VREAYNLINHFDQVNNDIVTGQGQVYGLDNSTGLAAADRHASDVPRQLCSHLLERGAARWALPIA
jgi:hypothetical protein